MSKETYDIIITGAGPAGLTAGLYTSRGRAKTLLLEKLAPGGQAAIADMVENIPGFDNGIKGAEFIAKLEKQATGFGLKIKNGEEVKGIINTTDNYKVIKTQGGEYRAKAIILALGARPKKLGAQGEDKLVGRGVSYCATCDGPLFRDKDVAVIGGGDTAIEDALFLARFCRQVTVVHRRDKLRATKILQERAFALDNLKFAWNSVVTEIIGDSRVEQICLRDVNTKAQLKTDVSGVFIFVGLDPDTKFLQQLVDIDDKGFIVTDEEMKTSAEGIFACGDCRKKNWRQIVTACAEGATAGFAALNFTEKLG